MTEDLSEFGVATLSRPTSSPTRLPTTSLRIRPSSTPLGPRDRTRSVGPSDISGPTPGADHPSPASPTTSNPSAERASIATALSISTSDSMYAIIEGRETPLSETARSRASPAPSASSSIKRVTKPPALAVPAKISFESVPIQWKGLPMEAALWTFTSEELQRIVSRSIRASGSESFVRLLSLDLLDKVLPAELERLEEARFKAQAKYRFLLQRRMMLLQALNSRSFGPMAAKDAEDAMSVISTLTVQLSQIATECDQQVEELLKIHDQQAQINKIIDVHSASSLAIALRKLNSSYGKRTGELNNAKEKIRQLQGQLEDAWKEAERLAREMDELDAVVGSDDDEGEVVISKAAVVSIPQSPSPKEPVIPQPMVPTYFTIESLSRNGSKLALAQSPAPTYMPLDSPQMVPSEITPTITREPSAAAVEPSASPVPFPKDEAKQSVPGVIVSDTVSIKSVRSNRSTKSNKSAKASRADVVSAARTRSLRVSQGSLRLGHQKKTSLPHSSAPPLPGLPTVKRSGSMSNRFTPSFLSPKSFKAPKLFSNNSSPSQSSSRPSHAKNQSGSTTRTNSTLASSKHDPLDDVVLDIRKRTSLEDLHIIESPTSATFPQNTGGVTADDIYVSPRRETIGDATALKRLSQHVSTDDLHLHAQSQVNGRGPSEHIPSIWLSVDAPKTPKERVDALLNQGSNRNPYNKFKTLTKRYSLPFPLFNKASPNSKTQHRKL